MQIPVAPPSITSRVLPQIAWRRKRGFLLMVVIGLLALLLVVCVGFLAYTRQETVSVAHIRDKADAADLAQSAIDWTIACIGVNLFDAAGQVRPGAVISRTRNAGDPYFSWWYKPMEPGFSTWAKKPPSPQQEDSGWIYVPADYFPEGGVRGRYCVQVVDANAFLNSNDWTQDATPTQCQAAHICMDALGDQYMEFLRERKLGPPAPPRVKKPERYRDCWLFITRTTHSGGAPSPTNVPSPNWVTTNVSRLWEISYPFNEIHAVEGLDKNVEAPGPSSSASYTTYSCVDPDTGRSPVNVNTCFNSGQDAPSGSEAEGVGSYTLEGVFNVESLRRIIKIGRFYSGGVEKDAANWAALTPAEQQQVEDLKTKLAYQYQETLVRYFTATYKTRSRYPPYSTTLTKNYYDTYRPAIGGKVDLVVHAVRKFDFSETRFPCGVETFRGWVREDLLNMSTNNRNSKYTGTSNDAQEFVGVDAGGIFEVPPGQLDQRTASAIYDNIVPGNAILYPGHPRGRAVEDPLGELYAMRWGRDERFAAQYNVHGFVSADMGMDIVLDAVGTPDGPYARVVEVPDRQLVFGPDWFSTELTTASTTFIFIVTAQIVDARSVALDPNKPRVLYNHHMGCVVELAPDLVVETPGANNGSEWATTGLGYYRGGWPYKRLTSPDIMDKNCATLHPDSNTSAAKEWIDYRNVLKGQEGLFYRGANQTHRRVLIRAVLDMNQRISL